MSVASSVQCMRAKRGAAWPAGRGGSQSLWVEPWQSFAITSGADRTGAHYNDTWLLPLHGSPARPLAPAAESTALELRALGGGAAAMLPPLEGCAQWTALMTGGINFVDEVVSDDLYELACPAPPSSDDTPVQAAWHRLVCVAGDRPPARTGSVLCPLLVRALGDRTPPLAALVFQFGGSSPYDGPMNDLHCLVVSPRATTEESGGSAVPAAPGSSATTIGRAPGQRSACAGATAEEEEKGAEAPCHARAGSSHAKSAPPLPSAHAPAAPASSARAPADSALQYQWIAVGTKGPAPEPREMHCAFVRRGNVALCAPALLAALDARVVERVRAAGCSAAHGATTTADPEAAMAGDEGGADADVAPKLVVWGGRNADGKCLRTLHVLDLQSLTWSAPITLPYSLASAAAATPCGADDVWLYAFGGWAGETKLSSDLLRLDARHADPSRWTCACQGKFAPAGGDKQSSVAPRFASSAACGRRASDGALVMGVFGGMNAEEDVADLLLFHLTPPPPLSS